jgi:hypothetical protein
VRANALLAAHSQVNGFEHLVQRELGILKDRSDLGGELIAALATLVQAVAVAPSGFFLLGFPRTPARLHATANDAAVWVDRAVRPHHALQILEAAASSWKRRRERTDITACSLPSVLSTRRGFVTYVVAKKRPDLAAGPWKVWERMPERHAPYGGERARRKTTKTQGVLRNLQRGK